MDSLRRPVQPRGFPMVAIVLKALCRQHSIQVARVPRIITNVLRRNLRDNTSYMSSYKFYIKEACGQGRRA